MNVLVYFAALAPDPSVVWMLPFACIVLSIVYAVLTHRMDMMLGAAFVLCFYTAGHLYLPTFFSETNQQKMLVMTLHLWFSCIVSYALILSMLLCLLGDSIAWTWRTFRPKAKSVPVQRATQKTARPTAQTKVAKPKAPAKALTLNELAAQKKTAPKRAVVQKAH